MKKDSTVTQMDSSRPTDSSGVLWQTKGPCPCPKLPIVHQCGVKSFITACLCIALSKKILV